MKKVLHLCLLLGLLTLSGYLKAQTAENSLQQQKVKFFNEKLQLTAMESRNFWPIYNDFQNRKSKINADRNSLIAYFRANSNNMSSQEASEAINRYLSYQEQDTELLETYTNRFREFLPEKKVMQIYIVELEFTQWLLQNLRENRVVPRE